MGTMEANFMFWSFFLFLFFFIFLVGGTIPFGFLEVTRTSRMHKNSLQAGTYQNTSLACLNNFFIFIFFISVMVLT